MSEPTDPLAELRAAAGAIGGDPEERDSAIITAIEALRYLTSPEAEVEIARKICSVWDYEWDGNPDDDGKVAPETNEGDDRPSKALYRKAAVEILQLIAEKAVKR